MISDLQVSQKKAREDLTAAVPWPNDVRSATVSCYQMCGRSNDWINIQRHCLALWRIESRLPSPRKQHGTGTFTAIHVSKWSDREEEPGFACYLALHYLLRSDHVLRLMPMLFADQ